MGYLVLILTWFHIFFVIGWFGSFLYFLFVLFPLQGKLSPQSVKDLMFKLLPPHELYSIVFATGAILFGATLFLKIGPSQSTTWFHYVWPGIITGVIAYILMIVAMIGSSRMHKAIASTINQPQVQAQSPPKSTLAMLVLSFVFLLATMSLMVLAASV